MLGRDARVSRILVGFPRTLDCRTVGATGSSVKAAATSFCTMLIESRCNSSGEDSTAVVSAVLLPQYTTSTGAPVAAPSISAHLKAPRLSPEPSIPRMPLTTAGGGSTFRGPT